MGRRLVLSGGLVFDGTGGPARAADVAVEDGLIVEVGPRMQGDERLDVAGRTVFPGFIDCHTHVSYGPTRSLEAEGQLTPSYLALESAKNLRVTVDAGITTVRDAAGADVGYKRAVEDGLVTGPRILVSLMQLSSSAGPYDSRTPAGLDWWIDRPGIPRPVADGPDGLRAKVREYVQAGADVIKIFATGTFAMPRDGARRSLFTDAELGAIVDEAGRQGVPVMAHAHGDAGAAAAARAGVVSIEHGFYLGEAALDAMAAAGTVFVPTLLASQEMLTDAVDGRARDHAEAVIAGHRAAVRAARERGIPIAMGTDCPVTPHGRNLEELALLVECGLQPGEALAAATSVAARLLGMDAEIGRIAPGHRGDLVVVEGDTLILEGLAGRITDVFQAGARVGPSAAHRGA